MNSYRTRNLKEGLAVGLGLTLSLVIHSAALPDVPAQSEERWTLERALQVALESNPDARVAERRIAAAQGLVRQADAAFWPQFTIGSGYIRSDHPMSVFGSALNQRSFDLSLDFNDPSPADNLNLHGRVSLPLYAGGRNLAGREAARAEAAAARWEADGVRNQLGFEVARTYFAILKARELSQAAASAVEAFEANRSVALRRFEAGTILKTELLDVEVRLAEAKEYQARVRNAAILTERAFGNLLGLEQTQVRVTEEPVRLEIPATDDYSSRPELEAAARRIEAAEALVRRARGGYHPSVEAFGQYDDDRGWEFDGSGRSWTAGVLLRWDLWDGQRTRGKVESARAELAIARERERQFRLQIDLEVAQARLSLSEANERLSVTQTSILQARESAALTRARFEQGLALATQLIDAETALTAVRARRAEAEADQRIAVAALRKALGLGQLSYRDRAEEEGHAK